MKDYYRLLGIPASSGADEVAAALGSPPEGVSPEDLADAGRAFGDPERRREYDALLLHGREVRRAYAAREAAFLRGDAAGALERALELTKLAPENGAYWTDASRIAGAAGLAPRAREIALAGTRAAPGDPAVWHQAALASLAAPAEAGEDPGETARARWREALDLARRAIAASGNDRRYQTEYVRLLQTFGALPMAVREAERYVLEDRTIDWSDFGLLQLLFDAYADAGFTMGQYGTLHAMRDALEDPAAPVEEGAARLLGQAAFRLAQGEDADPGRLLALARETLARLPEGEAREAGEARALRLERLAELAGEVPILRGEEGLLPQVAAGFALIELGRGAQAAPYLERVEALRAGVLADDPEEIRAGLDRLRERYPATWEAFGARMESLFLPGAGESGGEGPRSLGA